MFATPLKPFLIVFGLVAAALLAACDAAPVAPDRIPTATPAPNAVITPPAPGVIVTETAAPTIASVPTATAERAAPRMESISDEEARSLMFDLLYTRGAGPEALQRIVAARDARFTAVLIEMLRMRQIGIVPTDLDVQDYLAAIKAINEEDPGDDWFELIEWYGQTDLVPPPGFTSWKGQLLSPIDLRFAGFLNDEAPSRIRVEEIQWGGVRVDGIPALDQPAMVPAVAATYMNPDDAVFGLAFNGEARAYPLRILDWHEMANDVVGGVPVSLAYCTLCGAAVAFDGRIPDGRTLDFGSSGFLFRSNKLMYDRQTNTLWNQLTGEPVLGELADSDLALEILPVVLTTWADWQAQHPDTLVLDIDTGFERNYAPGAAYGDYFAYDDTMFPVWQRSDLLAPKDQIFAIRIDELPKAYPIATLIDEQVVNDRLGETDVVLLAPQEIIEVQGESQRRGPVTYRAGSPVRAYERAAHTFAPGSEANTLVDEDGAIWQVTEEALLGPDGQALSRLGGHLAYWFGWYAFFPTTAVYGQ